MEKTGCNFNDAKVSQQHSRRKKELVLKRHIFLS
jgi:hypothetical protein